MNTSLKATQAYLVQSVLAFAIALAVVIIGEINLPVAPWTRAFLALGTVFLVSSSFTLAKCIRDQHETSSVLSRIDQARLEKLLAQFDPYQDPIPGPVPGPAKPAFAEPPFAEPGAHGVPAQFGGTPFPRTN